MHRILIAQPTTLSAAFTDDDGSIVDPGTVRVTITRADGTPLATAVTASGTGAAERTLALTAQDTSMLDELDVSWTSSSQGTVRTLVQVVGAFLFSVAEARAAPGGPSLSVDAIAEARVYAETELERAVRYALVPRYTLRTAHVERGRSLDLGPYARAVRSVTVGTTVLSVDDLDALTIADGFLSGYAWPTGAVTIGYEHGLDAPPPGATKAALSLALDHLGGSDSIDPRATSIETVDGTIRLRADSEFTAAGVDAWVEANRMVLLS